MTQDSGSERPRTVAELLAEYGGASGDAPRRRRRRAEDDGDSAPQTIIERVLSDSGKLLPIRDDQPAAPPRRGGGHRSGEHRPVGQPPAGQPQQAPPAQAPQQQAPPQQSPQATGYSEPVRPPGRALPTRPVQQPPRKPQQQAPVQPQQPSGPQQVPQFPPSRPAMPPVGSPPSASAQSRPQGSRAGMRPVNRPIGQPTISRQPVRPQPDDEAATAVHPPMAQDFAAMQPPQTMQPTGMQPPVAPPPVAARLAGMPPEATTEEFPLVPGEPQGPPTQQRPGPPTGRQAMPQQTQQTQQVRRPAPPPQGMSQGMESTEAHAGPYVDDDFDDDYPQGGVATATGSDEDVFRSRDDFDDDLDDGPVNRLESFDGDDDDAPSGREWLLMAAQVGVGAIGGAAVWLAFSWLWGMQPVVAVVAALLVIVGLVMGVRRWRRADDLQTTVLAILAGLVVTVSPAALLLLHR
ncbi:MAG TPA: hypothetical protein VFX16_17540 [Pseudonocardiaceae bacterium]|nr:hypothetical protein [Pseudonocardiaceae bacterium]